MAAFGWILLVGAFLIFVMVSNNSWPWVWSKLSGGIPQAGSGNKIVPTPSAPGTLEIPSSSGIEPGTIQPTPDPSVPSLLH